MTVDTLPLRTLTPLKAQNAGLFISRGSAMHPTRVIPSHELIFVKQGELDMWEEDRFFHLEAGQTLHLFPGREHGSTMPMPIELKFYWIHFEMDYPNDGDDHSPALKVPQVSQLQQPERLERLFRTFLDDQELGILNPVSANLLTMLMLVEVAHCIDEQLTHIQKLNFVASRAHNYIRMNFDRHLTTSKVAEVLGYNADYLGRIYHKAYGCTLTETIHRKRLTMACDYLLDTSLTIEQIAEKCGFTNSDYFGRLFRRQMGMAPNTFRKEYSHRHVNTH